VPNKITTKTNNFKVFSTFALPTEDNQFFTKLS